MRHVTFMVTKTPSTPCRLHPQHPQHTPCWQVPEAGVLRGMYPSWLMHGCWVVALARRPPLLLAQSGRGHMSVSERCQRSPFQWSRPLRLTPKARIRHQWLAGVHASGRCMLEAISVVATALASEAGSRPKQTGRRAKQRGPNDNMPSWSQLWQVLLGRSRQCTSKVLIDRATRAGWRRTQRRTATPQTAGSALQWELGVA